MTGCSKEATGKSAIRTMRKLHRDIGFLLIGLTVVYCLSGIVLVYRDQGFLKSEQHVEKHIDPGLSVQDIGRALHLRNFKLVKQEGNIIYFDAGTYDGSTGEARYVTDTYPSWMARLNGLHMLSSRSVLHFVAILYGILLLFLAISSFWMYTPGTKNFKRGVLLASTGGVLAAGILLLGPMLEMH